MANGMARECDLSQQIPRAGIAGALCALPVAKVFELCRVSRQWREAAFTLSELPSLSCGGDVQSRHVLLALPALAKHFRRLPRSSVCLTLGSLEFEHDDLVALEDGGIMLRELSVTLADGMGDLTLASVLAQCPSLICFEACDYDLMSEDIGGTFLSELPPALESLSLRLLPLLMDASLREGVVAAPRLRSVNLEGLDAVTDVGFAALAELPDLRELRLTLTRAGPFRDPQLTEETLCLILRGAASAPGRSGLEVLEVSNRVDPPLWLSEEGLPLVRDALRLHPRLWRLVLSGVDGLGDGALSLLADACPGLRALSLHRPGAALTSQGLMDALPRLGELEELSLRRACNFEGALRAACSCASKGSLRRLELTHYFGSSREVGLCSVVETLRAISGHHKLQSAIFRGTFSSEQVESYRLTAHPPAQSGQRNPEVERVDESTYVLRLAGPSSADEPSPTACEIRLERCFQESFFV